MFGSIAEKLTKAVENPGADLPIAEFCKRRLRIRPREGGGIIKFELRPIQHEYLRQKAAAIAAGKPRKFMLLKYRRGGFSTLEQAINYQLCVTRRRMEVATLAHTAESTVKISGISKLFREEDPDLPPEAKERDDRISLEFKHTKSKFHLGTAGGKAFGRGDTLQRVHCSEVAWWCEGPNQFDVVERMMSGLTEATEAGEIVLETTPNGVEWFCGTFRKAMAGLNDWTPIFLPWFVDRIKNVAAPGTYSEEEVYETLDDEEKDLAKRHNLTAAQIAWRRQKRLALGRLFKQEYPEDPDTCFLSSGTPFFDLDLVSLLLERHAAMHAKVLEDVEVWHLPGGTATFAEQPHPDKQYVIGADPSEGLPHSDPCAAPVLERETGNQVAWLHGRWRPETFAKHLHDVGRRYNDALLGVERINHGHSVLNTLQNTLDYPNLFYMKNERGNPGPGRSGQVGWTTSNATRPMLLDDIEAATRATGNAGRWRWRQFLSECMTFKLQSDGQYRADNGSTDDAVMSTGIAEQMRKYARGKARVIILE